MTLRYLNLQNSVIDVIHGVRESQRGEKKTFSLGHVKFKD